MRHLRAWVLRLGGLFGKVRREQELAEELDSNLAMHIEDNLRAGMAPEEARRQALIKLGGIEQTRERYRDRLIIPLLETLIQDLRFGLRQLRRSPGFTLVAVVTLALGMGATTTIFSLLYAVILQPLPFRHPQQLLVLHETTPRVGIVSVSYPDFLDWRAQSHSFSRMAAVGQIDFTLRTTSVPEQVNGVAVSPDFLPTLGVQPILGHDFSASEEKTGAAPVAILSYPFWQSHYGGDPNTIGRPIRLDNRDFTIIGVLPANLQWLGKPEVMVPMGIWAEGNSDATDRGNRGDMLVVGRMAKGVNLAEARAEMEGIGARLAREYPATNDQFGVSVLPIRQAYVGTVRRAVLILFGGVIFVLLIACANAANLLLARGTTRSKEIAVRLALGANRRRIFRQMLTESLILACLGGALGVVLALAGVHGMLPLVPTDMRVSGGVSLNSEVLLFAAAVVILAALAFGFIPALQSTSPDLQSQLKEGRSSTTGDAARNHLRSTFVVAEVSLALILLAGAGLMVKSLYSLIETSPGFEPARVLTMEIDLPDRQYSNDRALVNFWRQALDRVRALPGMRQAALGTDVPFTDDHNRTDITIEGMRLPRPGSFPHPDMHTVSPGYAATLGIPLLRGRTFTEGDNQNTLRVALVNTMLAKQSFPNTDPIGKRFMFGHPSAKKAPKWYTIVGVLGDTKLYGLQNQPRLEIYVSYLQDPTDDMHLVVQSSVDPHALISSIRRVIAGIDKGLPVVGISTVNQLVSDSLSTPRITLVVLGLFSGLALVLAAIGIYGVMSYTVAQRTHEIGIRMALGAQRHNVLMLVVRQGMALALTGVAIGIAGALGLTRFLSSLLYGVKPTDALTLVTVSLILVAVAVLACYIPAHRATKVDPMTALRYE
jgi:putative ABC transport system permease protein